LEVPNVVVKSELMFLLPDWEAEIEEFETKVTHFVKTLEQLHKSQNFDKFLEILLCHVNFFRINTKQVPLKGLNITSHGLSRFLHVHKQDLPTILQYIEQFCQKHHPEVCKWVEDFSGLAEYKTLDDLSNFAVYGIAGNYHQLYRKLEEFHKSLDDGSAEKQRVHKDIERVLHAYHRLDTELAEPEKLVSTKYHIPSIEKWNEWGILEGEGTIASSVTSQLSEPALSTLLENRNTVCRAFAIFSVFVQLRLLWQGEGKKLLKQETGETSYADHLNEYDGYVRSKGNLLEKHKQGFLNEDDLCEELEQVLLECLLKKKKIVRDIVFS